MGLFYCDGYLFDVLLKILVFGHLPSFFMNQGKRDPEFIDHCEEIIFVSCESQSGRPSCAGHRRRPCGS